MKFKKLTLAGCVLAALAGGASAQSSVVLSGGVDLGLQRINGTTMMAKGGDARSNLTFTATEDLGDGMFARAVMHMRFKPDDGTINPTSIVNTPNQFWRQTWVELGSKRYGTLRLGRALTPLQECPGCYEAFGTETVASVTTQGINAGGRYNNGIFYRSPQLGGFNVLMVYAMREDNVNNTPIGTFAPYHPKGIAVRYASGPIDATVAWDSNGLGQKTEGVYGSYDFGVAKLMAQYERGDVAPGIRPVTNLGPAPIPGVSRESRWSVSVKAPVGAWVFKAGYLNFKDEKIHKVGIGFDYFLSKRTSLYSDVAKLGGDNPDLSSLNRKTRFDAGIQHRF